MKIPSDGTEARTMSTIMMREMGIAAVVLIVWLMGLIWKSRSRSRFSAGSSGSDSGGGYSWFGGGGGFSDGGGGGGDGGGC
jgi:hypothetical protein